MKYQYRLSCILFVFLLLLTGCTNKNKDPNENAEPTTAITPTTSPTEIPTEVPTEAPISDTDPFDLKSSNEPYPFQSTVKGVRKYGYFKLNGDIMIEPTYQKAGLFYGNLAVILTEQEDKDTKEQVPLYKIIDKDGVVLYKNNTLIQDFKNGYTIFADEENSNMLGYMDTNAEVAIKPQFLVAYPFNQEGEAYALTEVETYVKLNTKGEVLETHPMDPNRRSYTFPDGYLIYYGEENMTMGVSHLDGSSILDPIYNEITYLGHDLFAVKKFDADFDITLSVTQPCAIIKKDGTMLSDFIYYDITPFTNGYASATNDKETFLIGLDGKIANHLPVLQGRGTMTVIDNLIQANIDNEFIYLDIKGNTLWESNVPIQLNDTLTVHYEKYKSNKYVLIYYPSLSGLADLELQTLINDKLKSKFIEERIPDEMEDNLTISDSFEVFIKANLLVVQHSGYDYSLGAAHGTPLSNYYHIDLTSGTFYNLSDLFKEGIDYVSLLNPIVKEKLDQQTNGEDTPLPMHTFETIRNNHSFYVKGDDLILYFQSDEIAPYAAGFPEVSIPLKELDDLINKEGNFWMALNP